MGKKKNYVDLKVVTNSVLISPWGLIVKILWVGTSTARYEIASFLKKRKKIFKMSK